MKNKILVDIQNINFQYSSKKKILEDISFSVEKGKIVGILGPNGCGKTTLFNIMADFIKPTSGSIYLDGKNINKTKIKEKAKIFSYIQQSKETQNGNFYNVYNYVLQGRRPYSVWGFFTKEDEDICRENIHNCNLDEFLDHDVSTLSGGEFQRCCLARVFTQNTTVIIGDEPVSAMDIKYQKSFFNLLKQLIEKEKSSKCAIISLHDINLARQYCDKIIILGDKHIKFNGAPNELTDNKLTEVFGTTISTLNDNGRTLFDCYAQ